MMPRFPLVLALGLVLGACGTGPSDPTEAQTTYGEAVDAINAVPAPAVAAEESLYVGHSLAIDGRITAVEANGCTMRLATDTTPLIVTAARTDTGDCAWHVPTDTDGFIVAAGTLHAADDTLRLTANGVRVTPVRLSESDS